VVAIAYKIVDLTPNYSFDYDIDMRDKGRAAIYVSEDPDVVYFSISEESSGDTGPILIGKMWDFDQTNPGY
jgi:hypothetical protein